MPYQEEEAVEVSSLGEEVAVEVSVCCGPEVESGPSLWHSPLLFVD